MAFEDLTAITTWLAYGLTRDCTAGAATRSLAAVQDIGLDAIRDLHIRLDPASEVI
jgi:hypothetical protein